MTGLTSITFRNLDYKEIIDLCHRNKVQAIEWGADIHVPPGDLKRARKIGEATRANNIATPSYGTYYHLGKNKNIKESFLEIINTAQALGARIIRVWPGNISVSADLDQVYEQNVQELKIICQLAAKKDMIIGLEYHRGTLTQTKEMTLKLLRASGMDNLKTYWQLNPDISHQERLNEIKELKDYICVVHVFYWRQGKEGDIRESLAKGTGYWEEYWSLLKDCDCLALIEFVKNDEISAFEEDIKELNKLFYRS